MKEEEIVFNRELITQFMDYPLHEDTDGRIMYEERRDCLCYMEDFDYHESWDWLMPVVEKIESLGFEVLIGRISCNINRILDRENPISSFVCGDISKKIEIVYLAVVQFINWYNKNK